MAAPQTVKKEVKNQMAPPVQSITDDQLARLMESDAYIGKAISVHLAVGLDLIGSITSLRASRDSTLEAFNFGVIAISGKNGRKILLYGSNIKGVELAK